MNALLTYKDGVFEVWQYLDKYFVFLPTGDKLICRSEEEAINELIKFQQYGCKGSHYKSENEY